MLRELLTESRDFGTLLGGGSGPGGPPGGALGAFVPDPEERKRLFEAVAYECQVCWCDASNIMHVVLRIVACELHFEQQHGKILCVQGVGSGWGQGAA